MLKSVRVFPENRPFSRLEINYGSQIRSKLGAPFRSRAVSQENSWKKVKVCSISPTKENDRPRINTRKQRLPKAAPTTKTELPLIKNRFKQPQEPKNRKKPIQDFETYCAQGHPVFVDERDAGVKLGHLNKVPIQNQRKMSEHKNYLGETAYVPFNIDILKRKVEQKLSTNASTCLEESP